MCFSLLLAFYGLNEFVLNVFSVNSDVYMCVCVCAYICLSVRVFKCIRCLRV